MATAAYYTWDAKGRPFKVARPVEQMVAYAQAHGIAWLGTLGSDDERHLQNDFPEDHCPYSFTAEPLALPLRKAVAGEVYWVCACDLANQKGLGAAILRDARAGRLPWLKYVNVAGHNYHAADGFKNGAPNSDQHIHLSVWSDDLLTNIGDYDPLGEDMTGLDDKVKCADGVERSYGGMIEVMFNMTFSGASYPKPGGPATPVPGARAWLVSQLKAIAAAEGAPVTVSLSDAQLDELLDKLAARLAQ